jgi:hypothetical protein
MTTKSVKSKTVPGTKATGRKQAATTPASGVRPGVWRKMSRLSIDALEALDAGNLAQVRGHLEALRAVATCADDEPDA